MFASTQDSGTVVGFNLTVSRALVRWISTLEISSFFKSGVQLFGVQLHVMCLVFQIEDASSQMILVPELNVGMNSIWYPYPKK